jgi:hypothetical protein
VKKEEALSKGYCEHCTAYHPNAGFNCGVGMGLTENVVCRLPQEAVLRFKGEFGLEGATKRSISSDSFGDVDQMKKKRGRKRK